MSHNSIPTWLKMLLAILLAVSLTNQDITSLHSQEVPNAKMLFLYTSDCQDCLNLLEQEVQSTLAPYGAQVELVAVDISLPINKPILEQLQDKYNRQLDQVPILIIGDVVLIGRQQIALELNDHIRNSLNSGGTDFPIESPVPEKSALEQWTPVIAAICIGLFFIVILLALLINTNRKTKKLTDQVRYHKSVAEKSRQQIGKLNNIIRQLEEKIQRDSSGDNFEIDKTLETLIGLSRSPVDLLSEAQRILYYKDKRSPEDTVKDANGYLISLLRNIASSTGIRPIALYEQIVQFDGRYHTCHTPIARGEKAKVIETGWIRDDEVVKKAVVEKI